MRLNGLFSNYANILPVSEMRILSGFCLSLSLEQLVLSYDKELSLSEQDYIKETFNRRLLGEPIAYIIGKKEFYGLDFLVNRNVLIPRPETELIVDEALKHIGPRFKLLDLCAGSGAIGIATAKNSVGLNVDFVDIDPRAMEVACENAKKHDIHNNANFILSDLFENIPKDRRYNIILSNPPYIPYSETALVADETYRYEPHLALFCTLEGLEFYIKIASNAAQFLEDNGMLIIECGHNQSDKVQKIFEEKGWLLSKVRNDLAGYPRCLIYRNLS